MSVLGLTLDKAVYTLVEERSMSAHVPHTAFPVQSHPWFPECSPKPWENTQKSIIYTHCRSNLFLTTSGTSCSGGTKSHSNSPSHTDTEPDGSRNSRSVHVVQQDCWRPEKRRVKFCLFYIVLCCSTTWRNSVFWGRFDPRPGSVWICGGQSVIQPAACTNSLIYDRHYITLTADGVSW